MTVAVAMTGKALRALLEQAALLTPEHSAHPTSPLPAVLTGVADDSRAVVAGGVFVAVRGHQADGHQFIGAAVERGAVLVVAEESESQSGVAAGSETVPVLHVRDSRVAAALIAAAVFGEPAHALQLIGVTGTNGKTTTVHMIRALLADCGVPAASIGTLGVCLGREGTPLPDGTGLTTPGPVALQRTLRQLVDQGVRAVAMEVSSHALDQHRVEGLRFDAVVFTSFSRDHLDYHGTMEAYFAAKASLLHHLAPGGTAVVNADEPAWAQLPPVPHTIRFSGTGSSDAPLTPHMLRAEQVVAHGDGSECRLRVRDRAGAESVETVLVPLLGDFNVANAMGALAAAWALGCSLPQLCEAVARMPQVPGRLERLLTRPTVLRDYAHTPDALERALQAVRPFARTADGAPSRLWAVFGCGGDRDRGKRPEMGRIAEALADVYIITSDNPRTEDPERILDDIEAGLRAPLREPNRRIEDRRAAIAHALASAAPHDVVLLAGKGHETYQLRGTERLDFDEAEIVAALSKHPEGETA